MDSKSMITFREYRFEADFPFLYMHSSGLESEPWFLHFHNCLELACCESGVMHWQQEEHSFSLSAGELCLIPPFITHSSVFEPSPDASCHYIFFNPEELLAPVLEDGVPSELLWFLYTSSPCILSAAAYPDIFLFLHNIIGEAQNKKNHYKEVIRCLAEYLVILLCRAFASDPAAASSDIPGIRLNILPAICCIDEHFNESLSCKELAEGCKMTVKQLDISFKKAFNQTTLQYIRRVRLQKACRMLGSTEDSILSVAYASGFSSISVFNRSFKSLIGMSPAAYRNYIRHIHKSKLLYAPYPEMKDSRKQSSVLTRSSNETSLERSAGIGDACSSDKNPSPLDALGYASGYSSDQKEVPLKPGTIPISYRPYDFPSQFSVLSFFGQNWYVDMKELEYLHFHNCFEIGHCLSGSGTLCFENRRIPFSAGHFSIISPLEPHMSVCESEASLWEYIYFDPVMLFHSIPAAARIFDTFYPSMSKSFTVTKASPDGLYSLLKQLFLELHEQKKLYPYAVHSLLLLMLGELSRICEGKSEACTSLSSSSNVKAVQNALLYIFSHYNSGVSIGELSSHCCLSVSRFRKIFTDIVGISPLEYLQHYRIQNAKHLLLQGKLSISEISSQVGYLTLSSFNRQFLQYAGCSPSKWRQSHSILPTLQNICSLSDKETASVFQL